MLKAPSFKDHARTISYAMGSLGLYHLLFNRARLTTVMFHRILPRGTPAWVAADEDYTLDTTVFDQCLAFFARHYTVVSLNQVQAAGAGGPPLPAWPLLITFDDGWADTLAHAAPLLAKRAMPAACFVVSGVLDDPCTRWWQDSFGLAWRTKRTHLETLSPTRISPQPSNPFLEGLAAMSDLAPQARDELLDQWLAGLPAQAPRQMLTAAEVPALPAAGIAVGAHGASHVPLTLARDPTGELSGARARLMEVLGGAQADVRTLSFPHGRFDEATVAQARAAGYRLMFTSTPHLTELTGGRFDGDILGRIEVAARHAAPDGHFRPDLLACQLFLRESRRTLAAGGFAAAA